MLLWAIPVFVLCLMGLSQSIKDMPLYKIQGLFCQMHQILHRNHLSMIEYGHLGSTHGRFRGLWRPQGGEPRGAKGARLGSCRPSSALKPWPPLKEGEWERNRTTDRLETAVSSPRWSWWERGDWNTIDWLGCIWKCLVLLILLQLLFTTALLLLHLLLPVLLLLLLQLYCYYHCYYYYL